LPYHARQTLRHLRALGRGQEHFDLRADGPLPGSFRLFHFGHGEEDGVHYYFKSQDEFRAMINAGELAEWMEVHGNFYGTPRGPIDALLAAGTPVIMDIDVYGKVNFDKAYPQAVGILIVPPSLDVLEQRLRGRGTDSDETIALRLKNAVDELAFAKEKGKYEFTVVNDDFETAVEELATIVGA
jgi:guanylate kinase